jgi:type IV pilus assembly protein PilE
MRHYPDSACGSTLRSPVEDWPGDGFAEEMFPMANPCRYRGWRDTSGFTLVELMIVTALAAIILTLALPSYRNTLMRVHRTDAIRLLNQAALCQQRQHAVSGHYDTRMCGESGASGHYILSYSPAAQAQTQQFNAIATATGNQSGDVCGAFTLSNFGERTISGNSSIAARCWEGR